MKYIHKDSNHPPSILNQIPKSVEKRISILSSIEIMFNESKEIHQKALEKSDYQKTLKNHPSNKNISKNYHLVLMSKKKSQKLFSESYKKALKL